jgi:hypothetical protein
MGKSEAPKVANRIGRRVSVASALRAAKASNVYVFDSPKLNERLVVVGDIPFLYALLAEADIRVSEYSLHGTVDDGTTSDKVDMVVHYVDKTIEKWYFVNDEQLKSRKRSKKKEKAVEVLDGEPSAQGVIQKGIAALRTHKKRLDNILHLCAAFNRVRGCNAAHETELVASLSDGQQVTLLDLITKPSVDPAIMLGLVARAVLTGVLDTELDENLFGRMSILCAGNAASIVPISPLVAALSASNDSDISTKETVNREAGIPQTLRTRGRPRTAVAVGDRNYTLWPQVDERTLKKSRGASVLLRFQRRKKAVELYIDDVKDFETIERDTGISEAMVYYWLERCLLPDTAGGIVGFQALVGGFRVGYVRTKAVSAERGLNNGGDAGAFGQLLLAHTDIADLIEEWVFSYSTNLLPETAVPYREIHQQFKRALLDAGLTKDDYPLNRADCGRNALYSYCKRLEAQNQLEARLAREGKASAEREDGRGPIPRITALRPFSFLQLDFHSLDATGVVIFVDENGVEHVLPVARFYIGFLIDEKTSAILGFHYVLKLAPDTDSVLDILDSAVFPGLFDGDDALCKHTPDGKFLVNSFLPEFSRQGFAMIRMDRGWSNIAKDVTNNIMDVFGSAIQFGGARKWWIRPDIERIFRTITRQGVQRVPSTLGSGPQDSRRYRPVDSAVKYRIMVSDLIGIVASEVRRFNTEPHAGIHHATPLEVLRSAFELPQSPWIPQPLPLVNSGSAREDWMLFAHEESVRVSRDRKGARPCIRVSAIEARYRNEYLAENDWLVGERVTVRINRRDIRKAVAILERTGQPIGELVIEARWRESAVSWRDAVLIKRDGAQRRAHSTDISAASEYRASKHKELQELAKKKASNKAAKRAALDAARRELDERSSAPSEPAKAGRSAPTGPEVEGSAPGEPVAPGGWEGSVASPSLLGFEIRTVTGRGKA